MFDPVERDLAAYEREQDRLIRDQELIEEAAEYFLEECLKVPGFRGFLDKGFVSLTELELDLCAYAEVRDECVYFKHGDADEFVKTLIRDYEE